MHGGSSGASQAELCSTNDHVAVGACASPSVRMTDDRVIGGGTDGHDGVGHAHPVGETAGGADADDPRGAHLDQLAVVDRCTRATHSDGLHADRLSLERAGEAQHAALLVDAPRAGIEEGFGDVFGALRDRPAPAQRGRSRTARRAGESASLRAYIGTTVCLWDYLRNRDVVLSARTLPPVWHVGQYATVYPL